MWRLNALRLSHFKNLRNSTASANSFRNFLKRFSVRVSKRFKKMKILTRLDFERKGNLHLFKMIEVLRRLSKIIKVRSALAVAWFWMLLMCSEVSFLVRIWALGLRIFYIIAVIATIFFLSKILTLKIVRSEPITSIM